MNRVSIQLGMEQGTEDILPFEEENKDFFERYAPSRGASYFKLETVRQILQVAVEEQRQDLSYMYLVRNAERELVGKAQLVCRS